MIAPSHRISSSRLFVILLLLASVPGFGATAAAQMSAGVKGGVNIADVRVEGADAAALDPMYGAVVGGFVTLPAFAGLELQTEVLYSMKGARVEETGLDTRLMLDYIEVPVLARLARGPRGGTRYFVAGGPSFGLRVRARTRTDFGGAVEEIDISDDVERFDVGVAVGGGVELGALVIDARYTFGLTDIDRSEDAKSTNRVISLTAGLRF